MKRTLTRTLRLAVVLGVLAALSFGVQQAVASSATQNSAACHCQFPDNDACRPTPVEIGPARLSVFADSRGRAQPSVSQLSRSPARRSSSAAAVRARQRCRDGSARWSSTPHHR